MQAPPSYPPYQPPAKPGRDWKAISIALVIIVGFLAAGFGAAALAASQIQAESLRLAEDKRDLTTTNAILRSRVEELQREVDRLNAGPFLLWVTGSVEPGTGRTAYLILFDAQQTGTLSSAVYQDRSYQLWMLEDLTYSVTVYYDDILGGGHCTARPALFTPTQSFTSQSFAC